MELLSGCHSDDVFRELYTHTSFKTSWKDMYIRGRGKHTDKEAQMERYALKPLITHNVSVVVENER